MHKHDSGWVSAGLAGIYTVILLLIALWRNDGHFVYALDDPYIHLDIARQLALTGVYGLNPGEYAAPSSSILWPLLLVPFAQTPAFIFAPFIIGLAAAMGSALVITRLLPRSLELLPKVGIALIGILALNLPALALVGMEHGVHILLSLMAALACCNLLEGRKPPHWLWAVIILHPLLRYEGVLVSAACLTLLFWKGYRREAVLAGFAMCLPVIGFTLFLHLHGLGYFPGSTIVKKLRLDAIDGNFTNFWVKSLIVGLLSPSGIVMILAAFCAPLICLLRLRHWRSPAFATLLGITGVFSGHLLLGRLSTFETPRYDQYAIAFAVPLALWLLRPVNAQHKPLKVVTALALILLALPGLISSTIGVQNAITAIYQQQYQMQRLVQQYWHDSVAANDIGLVGLGTDAYVLDLVGLANTQVRLARTRAEPDWASRIVAEHKINLVLAYDDWVEPEVRENWIELGKLTRTTTSRLGPSTVLIMTPDKSQVANMQALLRDWAADLPIGSIYEESKI